MSARHYSKKPLVASGLIDARMFDLGGWMVDINHFYNPDPEVRELVTATGKTTPDVIGNVMGNVTAPGGSPAYAKDGDIASQRHLIGSLATDGTAHIPGTPYLFL